MAPTKSSPFHHSLRDVDIEAAVASAGMRQVLAACIGKARSVKEICTMTSVAQATAYRLVNRLQELDVLVVERSAMTADGKPYDLYRSRIHDAAIRVSARGSEVSWELDVRIEDRLLSMWDQLRMVA